jgi:hypothetical protein
MNDRLRAVAAAKRGLFTVDEARMAGYSDEQIQRLVRIGQWTRLRKGVLVETSLLNACSVSERHALEVRAAQSRLRRDTVASHLSALVLHEVVLLNPPSGVWLTSDVGRPKSYDGLTVAVAALPNSHRHVGELHGVEVLSCARALIDVARTQPFRDAVVAFDDALHHWRVTKDQLRACLADCFDWPGAATAKQVIDFAEPKTESPAESLSRVMFVEQGIEMPEPQVWIEIDGVPRYRIDFYWRRLRVIGEVDGRIKLESRDPNVLWEEKRREDEVRGDDHEVVRWTRNEALHRGPQTAARIRATFARAQRRAG